MKTQDNKYCYKCKYYCKYYKKVMAKLQNTGCGECRNVSARFMKRVEEKDTCEKWEEVQKPDGYNAESVIEEITDIMCRLHAVLYELNKNL